MNYYSSEHSFVFKCESVVKSKVKSKVNLRILWSSLRSSLRDGQVLDQVQVKGQVNVKS